MCLFWVSVHFLTFGYCFKNGSAGQTTMLTRRATKFCAEPRSPFSEISHQESKTIGKPPNIGALPECRPEFPSDGGGGDVPTTLDIWRSPGPTCPGTKYLVRGIPHFDLKLYTSIQSEVPRKLCITIMLQFQLIMNETRAFHLQATSRTQRDLIVWNPVVNTP